MASTHSKYTRLPKVRAWIALTLAVVLTSFVAVVQHVLPAQLGDTQQESYSHAAGEQELPPSDTSIAQAGSSSQEQDSLGKESQADEHSTSFVEQSKLFTLERSYEQADNLVSTAQLLLKDYQAQANALLVRSGYVDLLGRVWSCTIVRGSDVDICFVQERDATTSLVRVLRVRRSAIEELVQIQKEVTR